MNEHEKINHNTISNFNYNNKIKSFGSMSIFLQDIIFYGCKNAIIISYFFRKLQLMGETVEYCRHGLFDELNMTKPPKQFFDNFNKNYIPFTYEELRINLNFTKNEIQKIFKELKQHDILNTIKKDNHYFLYLNTKKLFKNIDSED